MRQQEWLWPTADEDLRVSRIIAREDWHKHRERIKRQHRRDWLVGLGLTALGWGFVYLVLWVTA